MRYGNHLLVTTILAATVALAQCFKGKDHPHDMDNPALIAEGKNIFRYDAFGDEDFWSGLLHLDKAIADFAKIGKQLGVLKS